MKRRKVLAMLMTAVMTFTSVAPETALVALAGDDDAAEDVVVEELPFDLKGMPEGYVLDEEQLELKADLKENDALEAFKGMTEGVDYEADTVFCLADSEEEAQTIAAAYNGELELYAQGVAEIKLNGNLTVEQAFTVAADEKYAMPVVEPSYITYLDEPEYNLDDYDLIDTGIEIGDGTAAKEPAVTWQDIVQGKNGAAAKFNNPDTYLKDPSLNTYQWMHDMIGTYTAWSTSLGSDAITVAVIDTGVYPDHPDLKGRVTQIKVGDIAVDDYTHSHGTHCAGIIGATANNGQGVAGVAPNVKILSLNIFASKNGGGCYAADEVRALNICIDKKVDVANMSLGGLGYSASEAKAMENATAAGVSVFCAMGNENAEYHSYPAAYNGAIGVASINPSGERSNFSNFGSWADIAAPGTDIMSCYNPKADNTSAKNNGKLDASGLYGLMSGTSMATPVAAGVAALYMSQFGKKTPAEITKIMQNTGTKTKSKKIGKIVNVGAMFSKGGSKAKAKAADDNRSFVLEMEEVGEGATVIYTVDGTTPSFLAGEVVNGQIYEGAVELEVKDQAYTATVKTLVMTAAGEIGDIEETYIDVPADGDAAIDTAKAAKTSITIREANGRIDDKGKAQIFTVNVPKTAYDDTTLTLTASTSVTWSSSSAKVLEVVTKEGTSTVVKGLKTGSAKITAKAADGSKATVTVKVIVPASRIDVSVDGIRGAEVAIGKSTKVKAVLGSTYGKPSVSKLEWDYSVNDDEAITSKIKAAKAVSISSSGKVSINKKKWESVMGTFDITKRAVLYVGAATTDGTNLYDYEALIVRNAPTVFSVLDTTTGNIGKKSYKFSKSAWFNDNDNDYVAGVTMYVVCDAIPQYDTDVTVSSSNPGLVGVEPLGAETDESGNVKIYNLTTKVNGVPVGTKKVCLYAVNLISGNGDTIKAGKAKITVKLNDGSNKKTSVTVTVK